MSHPPSQPPPPLHQISLRIHPHSSSNQPASLLPRSIQPAPLARFPCHHKPPEHQEPSSPCSSAPPTPSSSRAPPMAPLFPSTSTPPPRTPVPKHHLARLLPQAGARPAAGDLALRRPRLLDWPRRAASPFPSFLWFLQSPLTSRPSLCFPRISTTPWLRPTKA